MLAASERAFDWGGSEIWRSSNEGAHVLKMTIGVKSRPFRIRRILRTSRMSAMGRKRTLKLTTFASGHTNPTVASLKGGIVGVVGFAAGFQTQRRLFVTEKEPSALLAQRRVCRTAKNVR